jgi:tetratricopeptide (TPR) repeat protein
MFSDAEPLIDNMLLIDSLDFNLLKKKILINEFNLKNETAINQLKKAIQYDSLNVFYLSHLGDNYKIIDNIPLSTFYYEKAYQQNTKNQNIAKKLISNYLKTTPEKAIDICDTILKMDSLNFPFLRYKAFAYYKTNKVTESLKEYEKIYALGDSSVVILKRIGILKYKNNNFHDARPYLKKAIKLDSTDAEINFFYGCALANSPKKEEALKYLLKSIKLLEPEKDIVSAIYEHIAFTYRELKAYDQCLNYYLQAYELDPEKKKYLFFIASLYEHNLNEKMKAKEYYEMFLNEVAESDEKTNLNPQDNKYTSTYTNAAKISIERINEELFFEGNLK